MIERTIPWELFVFEYNRLSYLPGFERVQAEHWAEWYRDIFSRGWFPFELQRAISIAIKGKAEFFPPPGKILEIMNNERFHTGGRDWDSTLAELEKDHARWLQSGTDQKRLQ